MVTANTGEQRVEELAERLAEVYLFVGPLYRRALRAVEQDEATNRVSVGVRAVLDQLRRNGPMTVPQIGRSQSLSRQFVQRMVNEALADGLVELADNPHHRRSRVVRTTPAGAAVIEAVVARELARLRIVADGLSIAEVEATTKVLERMLDGLAEIE